jgi:hypothetical protein
VSIADDLHVDPADLEVIVEWLRACGVGDDLDAVTRDVLGADERALAYAGSPAAELALRYRLTGDPELLDQLRARGHAGIVGHLEFERPQPDDPASVRATRASTREHVDRWIAGAPPDPYGGPLEYRLGSPTD